MKPVYRYYIREDIEMFSSLWYWIKDTFGTREGEEFLDKLEKIVNPNKNFSSKDLDEVKDALSEHYKANQLKMRSAIDQEDAKEILGKLKTKTSLVDYMRDIFGGRKNEEFLDAFEKEHGIAGSLSDEKMQDIAKYKSSIDSANMNQDLAAQHRSRFKEIVKKLVGK